MSNTLSINEAEIHEGGDNSLFNIGKAEGNPDFAIVVELLSLLVNEITLKMELDTRASVSLVSEEMQTRTI